MSTISVSHLSKHFRIYKKEPGIAGSIRSFFKRTYETSKAVDDISFSIDQGELIGFIGPNGAGKTTTLKCLSGLIYPTSGKISVLGYTPFDRNHDYLRSISLVMGQKSQLWWDLPPIESYLLFKELYDISDNQFKKVLDELVELLDLKDILQVQVRKLSLGQRMKCELVAQLLHSPKILFLDEPTIGLDIVMQQKIRSFVREYNTKYNATVILTSHYMDDVKELCKRVIIINHGKLLFDGSLADIISKHTQLKRISVVFETEIPQLEIEKQGTLISYDGHTVVIEVQKEKAPETASFILSHYPVVDLTIEEPQIEEIIGTIFSSQKV
ncbi:ABC transporter [Candidatus Roizmanbacteria bacterium CG17_big_fil_post_rev_8_21_14_2_50_39_7]|uniref:ABC transporter n=1 Tax=Candidatus Roizmanbacteria bacterium CG17_big_fil_post_rev_8_21_14_2_50_39_7 TaxID=1974858 RepID=A0A2M7EKD3_9BACT|nr:MAG: ABC transporter [Candidatus Roizmanbacteria bacterium CG17_big_fil_post_rev_8_21_14_2_50_39_7]